METPREDDHSEQAEDKYGTQARRRTGMGGVLWWVFIAIALSVVSSLSGFFGSFQ